MMPTLQTSLDVFLEASQQAILNLSPKMNVAKPKTFKSKFRELPVEIRCIIYKHIFDKARLRIGEFIVENSIQFRGMKAKRLPIDKILRFIEDNPAAILSAFRWCRQEAIDILAQHTTLYLGNGLDPDNNMRDDFLALIDKTFLQRVTRVEVPLVNFLRFNLALLPGLKEVRLLHLSHHDMKFASESVHDILCELCGDPSCSQIWSMVERQVLDWTWKRDQILHLAKEHDWQLRYVCQWASIRSVFEFHMPEDEFELEFSLQDQQIISKWAFTTTLSGTRKYIELKNMEQVIKLGLFGELVENNEVQPLGLC